MGADTVGSLLEELLLPFLLLLKGVTSGWSNDIVVRQASSEDEVPLFLGCATTPSSAVWTMVASSSWNMFLSIGERTSSIFGLRVTFFGGARTAFFGDP